ncbi:MAG: GyrI-like domain-containing protein, partial [Pseudomonadota bacterium]
QGFARAMRKRVGASPSELAADADRLAAVGESLKRPASSSASQSPAIAVEIVDFAPIQLVAVRNTGDYAELNIGYNRVFELVIGELGEESIQAIYGIPHHDPATFGASELVFDCAIQPARMPSAHEDLKVIETPGGACLHLVHEGDYDDIHTATDQLYEIAIAHGLALSDDLPLLHYRTPPDALPEADLRSDIYLFLADI